MKPYMYLAGIILVFIGGDLSKFPFFNLPENLEICQSTSATLPVLNPTAVTRYDSVKV